MALKAADEYAELLDGVPWFEAVGTLKDETVSPVKDWAEAEIYLCEQLVWGNFRNSIGNRLHQLTRIAYPGPRQNTTNAAHLAAVSDVRKVVTEVIRKRKLKRIDEQTKRKQDRPWDSFAFNVMWDLNWAGFELVCQEDVPPLFFLPMVLPWYRRGHFPCGWRGTMIKADWPGNSPRDLPKGRLRVL